MAQTIIYEPLQPLIAGQAYVFPAFLFQTSNSQFIQINPTLAIGDVKISKDGGGYSNIASLPTEVGSSGELIVSLSALETMDATKYITIKFSDVSGSQWSDAVYQIDIQEAKIINLDNLDTSVSSRLSSSSYTPPPSSATIADSVWDEVLTGSTHNIPTSAGRRLRQIAGTIVIDGIAIGAGVNGNQIILDSSASSMDGAYDPALIAIVDGAGAGQCRLILDYVGSTKTATVDRTWKVVPNSTSEYIIYADAGREHVNEGLCTGGTINTVTLNQSASTFDDEYRGQLVFIRSGLGEDQVGLVIDYVGSTRVATIDRNWRVIPDTTSAYVMLPNHIHDLDETSNAVWINPTRELTDFGFIVDTSKDSVIDTISTGVSLIPTNPVLETDTRLDYLDALISSRSTLTASDVWAFGVRTLTAASGISAADVWNYATKELSAFGFTVNVNSNSDIVAIKNKTDNLPLNPASQTNLDVAVSTRLPSSSYIAPDNTAIQSVNTNMVTNTDPRLDYLDALISSRSTLTASDVWNYATRVLTAFGFTVDINSNSDIVTIKSKTNNLPLNPASQTNLDVAVSSRLATSDARLNALDTTISSRSTLSASDVWDNSTRTLTSGGGSGGATPTEIWEYPTRTITGASGLASSIWEYENRSLTNWRNIVSDIWKSIPKWFLEKVESIVESDIIVYKGVTNNIIITSPENVKGSSNIVFSVKNNYQDPDEKSIIRIELINGLVILNGQQYLPSINGGVTVVDENEGIINIYIHSEASSEFIPSQKRVYDILSRVGDEVKLVSRGKIDILPDVTKNV